MVPVTVGTVPVAPRRLGLVGRDLVVAFGALTVLLALTQLPVLGLPGFLLVVGFDALERSMPALSEAYDLWFTAYVLSLALVAAAVARAAHEFDGVPWWRPGVTGALAVVGVLAFVLVVVVFLPHGGGGTSLALIVATGLLLLFGAATLARRPV